ncbi:hypothetical protein Gasu2_56510 [Galdieria sulphuraria]|uniref:RING-type domain-containing protein n=1 Tax=Galdieria sulphuraria TaxID=130081 RepID=M2XSG9_GALSU|nr:uncharacterized protein Gasu_60190 [Galdieria sulphuraria]EME26344.1 hypothetical protein Gasu_60190 [Galdieria sulphuraria]GJD11516.1 hypothetical protein Gasu2_56510 [Galdieria sulphuraria]|eukprot:XP_005702864.1 hypothetical protein Gasu_60190 [Galdieria sulphuraria]
MDPTNSLSMCCICFEEFRQILTLLPCRHTRICHLCVCHLTELKCPICRENVETAVLSIHSKIDDGACKESEPYSLSSKSKISLSRLIEYRNRRSKEIVKQVYQVSIIGSSSVPFRHVAHRLQGKYVLPMLSASLADLLEKKIQTSKMHKESADFIEALHVLDGVEKWNAKYLPNCTIENHFIRINCFPFWEWLRILRDSGTPDVILPDVVVTCVSPKNKKSFSESLEMQKIMYRCYQLHHKTFQSIWLLMTSAECFETDRKLSLRLTNTIIEKPNIILWVDKTASPHKYQELGSQILESCLKNRKHSVCSKDPVSHCSEWDIGQMVLTT